MAPTRRPTIAPDQLRALNLAWHRPDDRPASRRSIRRFRDAWFRRYRGSANYVKVGFAPLLPDDES